ncbi:cytochrome P450 [Lentzea sp. NPDC005914]|uniref:cytochrome P450 n=1 Tax=Lentzea sp. NPDC005914 TaxID=3154572 RepID=UPI0033E790A0
MKLPFLGDTIEYMRSPVDWARDRYDRFGPVSSVPMFGVRMTLALGPDATEEVLLNRDKAFSNGGGWERFVGPFFHRGLLLLDFDEHLHHRRIMQQAFLPARLAAYRSRMVPAVGRELASWPVSARFEVYPAIREMIFNLTSEVLTGSGLGAEADEVNRLFEACLRASTGIVRFPVPGLAWSRGLAARRRLETIFGAWVAERRATGGPPDNVLSMLCAAATDEGDRFTATDVVNHMILLLLAARDTSTIALSTIVYYLAQNPSWQERCRSDSSAVELVRKEALRLAPPLPHLVRRVVRPTSVLGHPLAVGTYVQTIPQFNHHMHELWTNPLAFDPLRFSEERAEDKVHRYAWIPFGGGVHKCIGMHFAGMVVDAVMQQLLERFEWSVEAGYEVPWNRRGLPFPADGLPVRLTSRHKSHGIASTH